MRVILFDPVTDGHHIEYASYLIRYLVEQGDEVTFVTWKSDDLIDSLFKKKVSFAINYVMKDSEKKFGGNTIRRSWQLSQGIKYCFNLAINQNADVVHHLYLERSELPLYFRVIKSKNYSWKIFATLFWPYFIHEHGEKVGLFKYLYHYLNRWALSRLLREGKMDGLFVHTNRIRDKLFSPYVNKLFQQSIFVVPDPIELFPKISKEIARDRLGLPKQKPIILFFGGLRWDKGPDILLKTLPLIENEVYILIAGKPVKINEKDVMQYRQSLKNPEHLIVHLKHIPDKEIADYFSAVDAVVLPYRRTFKGTSGILQHAAAAGRPVIASDVGEVGSIVRKNNLGIIVEPESSESLAEGIKQFLAQPVRWREQVRFRAIQYAKTNHWRKMTSGIRKAYLFKVKK